MRQPLSNAKHGFSLVEVTLALGVASFALLAIFAVLPVGIGAHQSAMQQTAATNIATAIITDLRQTPDSFSTQNKISARYEINIASSGTLTFYLDSSGNKVPQTEAKAYFKAQIVFVEPVATQDRVATKGVVTISWPAMAERPMGTTTAFIALDRN